MRRHLSLAVRISTYVNAHEKFVALKVNSYKGTVMIPCRYKKNEKTNNKKFQNSGLVLYFNVNIYANT